MEDALEQGPVFVSMNPVFVHAWLDLFEFESRVWMERKPQPVFSWNHKIAYEQTFCGSRQVEHANYLVDFAGAVRTDGA